MPRLGRMRWIKVLLLLLFLINIFFVGQLSMAKAADVKNDEKAAPKDENLVKNILFITVDGLGQEAVAKGYTPNLNGLAGSGVKTRAISIFPANTPAALATIMTGSLPEEHKFTISGAAAKVSALPELIAAQKQSAVIIDGKNGISKGLSPKVKILTSNKDDKAAMDLAINEFEKNKPYFMHIILPGVDAANKKYGPGSPKQLAAVEEADKQIGRLLGKLHEYGIYQYSLIVVSGSYGVTNANPGKRYSSENEVLVPLIIKGPTIKSGITIPMANLTNITPTISYVLGLKTINQDSQVLWDVLKNEGGSSETYLLKKRIQDLGDSLVASANREFSLENEKLVVNEEKQLLTNERSSIQNVINAKEVEIKKRDFKLAVLKMLLVLLVAIAVIGYLAEYRLLKKKFLMFK